MAKRHRILLATLGAGTVAIGLVWFVALIARDPGLRILRSHGRVEDIAKASEDYFRIHAKWPTSMQTLTGELSLTTHDAWGYEILYIPYDVAHGCGVAVSLGADNRLGGVGRAADSFGCFGGLGPAPSLTNLWIWTRDAVAKREQRRKGVKQ